MWCPVTTGSHQLRPAARHGAPTTRAARAASGKRGHHGRKNNRRQHQQLRQHCGTQAPRRTAPSPNTPGRPADPGPRATRVHSPALLDLGLLDYIENAAREVIAHTYTAVPTAGPAPHDADAVYAWAEEHTAHLDAERRRDHDALLVRQAMEHALAAGDESVLSREPCPGCGCWGALLWRAAARRAVCVNRYCTDRHGRPSTWSLAHLADRHLAAREARRSRRAT
ncbi:hypothetical protein [Streptomyces sp. Ac-502]|uniref:hypothetical protein n=1 Tax=Streptomyces sp. Ac-502 TaxID=3342801 RepID=UPI0038624330